ncbi:MAG: hypothetical protein ACOX3X_07390 [Eubacteriales bacterium]|jgi:hypothetical protein
MIKKLNLLDTAIIILILAICFGGVVYIINAATADTSTFIITATVSDDTVASVKAKDKVYLESGEYLGEITAIRTMEDNSKVTKVIEITLETEEGTPPLKTGQPFVFTTHAVISEGVVYSITKGEG